MYFFEGMLLVGDLIEIRDEIAPLVSLARFLSIALTCEMLRGKKKRGRKARALHGGILSCEWNTSF